MINVSGKTVTELRFMIGIVANRWLSIICEENIYIYIYDISGPTSK